MTAEKLQDAISLLPADLIAEADRRRSAPRPVLRWQRFAAMAACFVMMFFGSVWCLSHLGTGGTKEAAAEAPAAMQSVTASKTEPEAAAPEMAEAAPKEETADRAAGETAQENSNSSAFDQSGNTACQQTATPEVSVSGDFAPRVLTKEERLALAQLLSSLTYRAEDVCECIAEITVTVNGEDKFFINLDEGFVRCFQGQARLTQAQIDTLRVIFYPTEED